MRAASTRACVGHEWVRQRFICHGDTAFVPASLDDNPYNLDRGEEYVKKLNAP